MKWEIAYFVRLASFLKILVNPKKSCPFFAFDWIEILREDIEDE